MARNFSVNWNATNTASATVPMGDLFASAAIMPAIYEINAGSDATADNAVKYAIQKSSARGTQSATVTPQLIDPNEGAAIATFDTTWNINPTLTANFFLLQWGQHQRGTYRWVAYDYTKMLQAAVSTGLALMSLVVTTAFNGVFSLEYQE